MKSPQPKVGPMFDKTTRMDNFFKKKKSLVCLTKESRKESKEKTETK